MFHDVRFPDDISYGSSGGPQFLTTIITLSNGTEQRLIQWQYPKNRYNVAYCVRSDRQLSNLIAFFRARMGKAHGFRFKDWADYQSCPADDHITPLDQEIGIGDGVTTTFPLVKHYVSGGITTIRPITLPVLDTVFVAVNGTHMPSGFSIGLNGAITFLTPPPNGASITAGFAFDVPVRFDTDYVATSLDSYGVGSAQDVPCVEIRA
jgi:uncharacterized protein (TIGR02217 family)